KLKIAKRNKKRNTDTLLCIKTWLEGKEYIVEDLQGKNMEDLYCDIEENIRPLYKLCKNSKYKEDSAETNFENENQDELDIDLVDDNIREYIVRISHHDITEQPRLPDIIEQPCLSNIIEQPRLPNNLPNLLKNCPEFRNQRHRPIFRFKNILNRRRTTRFEDTHR
ncbi:hypothetical protein NGRA_2240, partial [Nosema granulosis]